MRKILISVSQVHIRNLDKNLLAITDAYNKAANDGVELLILPAHMLSDNFVSLGDITPILAQVAQMTTGKALALVLGGLQVGVQNPNLYVIRNGSYSLIKSQFTVGDVLVNAHLNSERNYFSHDIEILFETSTNGIPIFSKKGSEAGIYINQVGGRNDMVWGGQSLIAANGAIQKMKAWQPDEQNIIIELHDEPKVQELSVQQQPVSMSLLYDGLVFATKNHLDLNGFNRVILGISGGIDSALTAYIAAEAVGAENVKAFMLPSQYTSKTSIDDAYEFCSNLGIEITTIEIHSIYKSFISMLAPVFLGCPEDVTEENLQARIRGTLLMAISNKTGGMLLSTGNKSEGMVGYATLYGDTCGGFSPIKHIYKTEVYELAKWINEMKPLKIPTNIINKAPTAELKPNQTDQDTLPPYEELDSILKLLMNEKKRLEYEDASSFSDQIVDFVKTRLEKSQHKRLQSPPGPNLSKQTYEVY